MKRIMLSMLIFLLFLLDPSPLYAPFPSVLISKVVAVPSYRQGEVLVKFKPMAMEVEKDKIKGLLGPTLLLKKIKAKRVPWLEIELLRLPPEISVEKAISILKAQGLVEYVSPNFLRKAFYFPNDPYFSLQWGLHNTGQTIKGVTGTVDADIDTPEAWDKEKGLTTSITVAVLDTGLDFTHGEFSFKVWGNMGEIAGNGIDDDGNGYIDDKNGYNWAGISQTNVDAYWYFGRKNYPKYYAQSIKGTGQKLTNVGIYVSKFNNPTQPITVSVRNSLTGSDLSSFTILPSEVGTSATLIYKPLSSVLTLSSGTTYYIVMRTTNDSTANYYRLYGSYFDGLEDYTGGMVHYSTDGLTWNDTPEGDFVFVTNPNPYSLDDNGHGTHVSGIVAAKTDNSSGVAGVSFGAPVMPLKVLDAAGYGSDVDIANAIIYAADNGAKVINMSFGGTSSNPILESAVNYAFSQGVTLLAAAGNDGNTTINYPAGYGNVIGVGATNNQDSWASFSNYNSTVDVSAPGVDVYSTMPTYPVSLTGFGYNYSQNYDYLRGTSMATPIAAGVSALILSRNPTFTPSKVANELQSTADDKGPTGWDSKYGWGRVNAHSSVSTLAISITTDGTTLFGITGLGETKDTTATGTNDVQTISVDSGPANLNIKSAIFSDGTNTWSLGSTNGDNQVKWEFQPGGGGWNLFGAANTLYPLASGLATGQTKDVYFRLTMPTATASSNQYGATVTIVATSP